VQSIEARALLGGFFERDGELEEELAEYFPRFNLIISSYDPEQDFSGERGALFEGAVHRGPHRPEEH